MDMKYSLVPSIESRFTDPSNDNLYYIRKESGRGWNPCIQGNSKHGILPVYDSVLPNCVGYVIGRINEINKQGNCSLYPGRGNACEYVNNAKAKGWRVSQFPMIGSIMCWSGGGSGCGHIAVVEKVEYTTIDGFDQVTAVVTSESGWDFSKTTVTKYTRLNVSGWTKGCSWMYDKVGKSDAYHFLGFIYPPYSQGNYSSESLRGFTSGGSRSGNSSRGMFSSSSSLGGAVTEKEAYQVVEKTREVEKVGILHTGDFDVEDTISTSLLSYPSLVETPFVVVELGGYTFGTYGSSKIHKNGSVFKEIKYPDYINSMEVTKVNGSVNSYTINLLYQVTTGNDPNLIDKILSSAGYGSTMKISYGDYSSPNFKYKEEEAIIIKVTSSVDFSSSQITYTISGVSNSFSLWGTVYNFSYTRGKPSDIIKQLFSYEKYGLKDIFTGMNMSNIDSLIASDDKVVELEPHDNTDVLSYINYLVTCMSSHTNETSSVIRDSTYYMTIHDDYYSSNYQGPYFTIEKVNARVKSMQSVDTYTVDVGYPSETKVMSFNIQSDDSWALLYDYGTARDYRANNYVYSLDDSGNMISEYSPGLTTSNSKHITTEKQKSWWTAMTQHPITANLTIKGLLRPSMLLTYVRVNAYFYGQRHTSSGLYVITKQVDRISGEGYRTDLSLLRIGGDDAYIGTYKATETYLEKIDRINSQTEGDIGEHTHYSGDYGNLEIDTHTHYSGTLDNHTHYSGDLTTQDHTHLDGIFENDHSHSTGSLPELSISQSTGDSEFVVPRNFGNGGR